MGHFMNIEIATHFHKVVPTLLLPTIEKSLTCCLLVQFHFVIFPVLPKFLPLVLRVSQLFTNIT